MKLVNRMGLDEIRVELKERGWSQWLTRDISGHVTGVGIIQTEKRHDIANTGKEFINTDWCDGAEAALECVRRM
jgi:hypothetical protein